MNAALWSGDTDRLLDYTYPRLVEMLGGREKAKVAVSGVIAELKRLKMEVAEYSFPHPPEFLNGGTRRFAIVPTRMIIEVPNGRRIESLSFQFGIQEPNQKGWKYLDGSRIRNLDLGKLFDGFPDTYDFPEYRQEVISPETASGGTE